MFTMLALLFIPHAAAVPDALHTQGRLLDVTGEGISGTASVTVTLWSAQSGGDALVTRTLDGAQLSDGYFSVILSDLTDTERAALNVDDAWIEVSAGSLIGARTPLVSVPAALHAETAKNVDGGDVSAESLIVTGASAIGTNGVAAPPSVGPGSWNVTLHDSTRGSDRMILAYKEVNNSSEAQLYILDDGDQNEAFAIYGDSCGGGNCSDVTLSSLQHRFDTAGNAWHRGSLTVNAGADIAERTPFAGPRPELGDVVVIGPDTRVVRSGRAMDDRVYGVVSSVQQASLVIGEGRADAVPVALVGRVTAKVSTDNGAIESGDWLVTSSIPGHLMRCADRVACLGAVAGKALEPFTASTGQILVLAGGR